MLPAQLLEWNRTEVEYPCDATIAELFSKQAALTPESVALIAGDRQLSYHEVDEQSSRLARHLQNMGVKPDSLVGVLMRRTETLVISLLAVLKAGGAYVPLDPSYPQARLSFVIEDSGVSILLTSAEALNRLSFDTRRLTILNVEDVSAKLESRCAVTSDVAGHNLAYVIYTSGSTGKPKGVMVEHRNVVNFFTGMDRAIGCEPGVWLAVTSAAFDISVLELLWTLTRGFTVVVHRDDAASAFGDEIARHRVTHLQMTPSLARMLTLDSRAFSALGGLKKILLGGEAVPASLIHRIREVFHEDIHNMYGPTETTIWSTTYKLGEPGITVPIGRPIANTQTYILDGEMKPVPLGEAGELFIGGDGVARGYWNRPDLTADRFLVIPSLSAQRIYRTGDIARFLPDGNIEYQGRADLQVKLRGHRIELGEIEAMLEQCSGIAQAAVILREDREGDPRLVAYLVAKSADMKAITALKSSLGAKLPETTIPSAFVFLSALPLTENGKIDRKALLELPPPEIPVTSTSGRSQTETAGRIERIVAESWKNALGVAQVGLDENFFDLGAHSLTIAEVQAKLQSALGQEIPLVDLFHFSTVRKLARHLDGTQANDAEAQISERAQRRRLARQN